MKTIDNTYKANSHWREDTGERLSKATVNGGQMVKTLLFSRSRFNSKKGVKKKGTKRLHFWSKIHFILTSKSKNYSWVELN